MGSGTVGGLRRLASGVGTEILNHKGHKGHEDIDLKGVRASVERSGAGCSVVTKLVLGRWSLVRGRGGGGFAP